MFLILKCKKEVTAPRFELIEKEEWDAVNWHFDATLDHLFSQYDEYRGKDLAGGLKTVE